MTDDYLTKRIKAEATKTARFFNRVNFEQCTPLTEDFLDLPRAPGIYAIKTKAGEILYIGSSTNVRRRFCKGHQTLQRMLIHGYLAADLGIALVLITPALLPVLVPIENQVIFVFQPSYNKYIPSLGS